MMNDNLQLRMLNDLLTSERNFRELAERKVRALTNVLTELAYRMAGEQVEKLRHDDPSAPQSWTPKQWQSFFQSVVANNNHGWKSNGNGDNSREIAVLQTKIAALERELSQAQAMLQNAQNNAQNAQNTDNTTAPLSDRLTNFTLPKIPLAYEHHWRLRGHMSKADAELHLRRRGMVLKCLADGMNVQIEIGKHVGDATGAQYRSGSIRRVFEALEKAGLIIRQTLSMQVTGNLPTRLSVARLSASGKQFCRAVNWTVAESDWERLIRLHEGEKQEGHTLSVLLFAVYARLQGYEVEVLPDVDGNARPDVAITRDGQRLYVEVETGTRLHEANAKWRMNAELNGGKVALVARNTEERTVLVSDCRQYHGYATDIQTIIASRFVDGNPEGLWAEEW